MNLFSNTALALENAVNYSNTRQKVLSNNIANADTPGYKSKKVVFQSTLQSELVAIKAARTDGRHLQFNKTEGSFRIVSNNDSSYSHNGNNVDIDEEMSNLAKNQIYYHALVERLSGKYNSLNSIIRGGK
ncbi:flagellar basal body rod protein FlgB [Bacillus carboniphilus]|uniref:Flagellar basal body rod protein FlgB n=1 Tax=Bacillus carboniphilus TaxID=86663 RepID=A0ABY9K0X3_9BACI|nr:flagellar basal body rod protein FlgB [Bacillus carboniphilus]WLR43546.1 flagellar basal body rod protein FlgB [Bacillus carboniphilus]